MKSNPHRFFVLLTTAVCLIVCALGFAAALQWWSIAEGSYDPVRDDREAVADVPAHIARLKMFCGATIPALAVLGVLLRRLAQKSPRP